jgi:hypothetical protein
MTYTTSWPRTTEPRTRLIAFRLSEAEHAEIAKRAQAARMSVSEFVRVSLPIAASGAGDAREAAQA